MKKCKDCRECRVLYRKGIFAFWQCNSYYCTLNNTPTLPDGVCSCWNKVEPHYDVSVQRIDEVIEDINFIKENVKD